MLVLSRRERETINLYVQGVKIAVRVVRITGESVRIGVTAPRDVTVVREEIADRYAHMREQP